MLTDKAVRNLKPEPKPYKKADSGGLYVLVMPNGSKLWRQAYRFAGKQLTLAHGSYPEVSLADARLRREEAKAKVLAMIPKQAEVMNMTSVTLQTLGLDLELINAKNYSSVRLRH